MAGVVVAVPKGLMTAGAERPLEDLAYDTAGEVVDAQLHLGFASHAESDRGARREGVRRVSMETEHQSCRVRFVLRWRIRRRQGGVAEAALQRVATAGETAAIGLACRS